MPSVPSIKSILKTPTIIPQKSDNASAPQKQASTMASENIPAGSAGTSVTSQKRITFNLNEQYEATRPDRANVRAKQRKANAQAKSAAKKITKNDLPSTSGWILHTEQKSRPVAGPPLVTGAPKKSPRLPSRPSDD